jgi:hypothetical protein
MLGQTYRHSEVVGRVGGGVGPDHLDNSIGKQFWINIVPQHLSHLRNSGSHSALKQEL